MLKRQKHILASLSQGFSFSTNQKVPKYLMEDGQKAEVADVKT